jgi:hypothetical protein
MSPVFSRLLVLTLAGADVSFEVTSAKIRKADADAGAITLAEARAGGKYDYYLDVAYIQDLDTASTWSRVYEHSGTTVAYQIGQADEDGALDTDQAYLSGGVIISMGEGDLDLYGGDPDADPSVRLVTEVSWKATGKPVLHRPAA